MICLHCGEIVYRPTNRAKYRHWRESSGRLVKAPTGADAIMDFRMTHSGRPPTMEEMVSIQHQAEPVEEI